MIHLILSALWDSAFAQFGLAGLVLIGAAAVFLWVPVPGAKHIATAVAAGCIVFLTLGPRFYVEGINHEKAKWDAAERAATERAAQARTEAEQEVAADPAPAQPSEPPAASVSGRGLARVIPARRVRSDRYDRDNR